MRCKMRFTGFVGSEYGPSGGVAVRDFGDFPLPVDLFDLFDLFDLMDKSLAMRGKQRDGRRIVVGLPPPGDGSWPPLRTTPGKDAKVSKPFATQRRSAPGLSDSDLHEA